MPPAASIFARAAEDTPWRRTVKPKSISPLPRSFTSIFVFLMSRFSTSYSGVTTSPASKRSRSRTFTGTVRVRKGPTGIASLDVPPRSLPIRM